MAIVLDHTIVPAHDNEASARFFARIFGLAYEGVGLALCVRSGERDVGAGLRYARTTFDWQHYAFKVSVSAGPGRESCLWQRTVLARRHDD
jgi:hypothetical protein